MNVKESGQGIWASLEGGEENENFFNYVKSQ